MLSIQIRVEYSHSMMMMKMKLMSFKTVCWKIQWPHFFIHVNSNLLLLRRVAALSRVINLQHICYRASALIFAAQNICFVIIHNKDCWNTWSISFQIPRRFWMKHCQCSIWFEKCYIKDDLCVMLSCCDNRMHEKRSRKNVMCVCVECPSF